MRTTSILANKLYADRETTGDVTFIVESECVFAHRLVLASLSLKYEAQFFGSHPDEGDIYVEDISAAAFNEFIKFLYLEDADFTLENIEEILHIAKQCLVEHVVTKCGIFLIDVMTDDNLLWIYRVSIFYDVKPVRDLCEINIRIEPNIFDSKEFLECDHEMLLHILNIKDLKFKEMDVLQGCISWAKAACRRKNLDAENMKNVRNELGDAIFLIQFWTLTLREFVRIYKTHVELLTSDEFIEITCIMGSLPEFASEKFKENNRMIKDPYGEDEGDESDDSWLYG